MAHLQHHYINIFTVGLYYCTALPVHENPALQYLTFCHFWHHKEAWFYRSLVLKMKSFFILLHTQHPNWLVAPKRVGFLYEWWYMSISSVWHAYSDFIDVRSKALSSYSRDYITFLLPQLYDTLLWKRCSPIVFIWQKCEKVAVKSRWELLVGAE